MFCESLTTLVRNYSNNTHPILKSLLGTVLLLGEEGADLRASPTEDRNNKRNLDFIAWMGEMIYRRRSRM